MKHYTLLLVVLCSLVSGQAANKPSRPNVLFIALDDLGPYLNCYGKPEVISPNIDRLASRGLLFNRAYSQQAICNASRASLLTGLRPDSTGVYDLRHHFREKVPEVVTLPQYFKQAGYHTQALGKIYHEAFDRNEAATNNGVNLDDAPSWSVPSWRGQPRYYYTERGVAEARRVFASRMMKPGQTPDDWVNYLVRGLATEAPDVPDNVLHDGYLTDRAITTLQDLAKNRSAGEGGAAQPFFLAVGFLKPHMPFIAPKKYWDLYDRSKITLAENNFPPRDAPPIASQVFWNEARAQSDVPANGPILPEQSRELRHGYYACVSFVDAQIGRIMDELARLGLSENTIVVLWGDHGYSLGENSIWAKCTNFETSVRAPLIISTPGGRAAGRKTDALVEFVDIYPTLCDLAGLPAPAKVEGSSMAPLFDQPDRPWKPAAFSQYYRQAFPKYRVIPLAIANPEGYSEYPKDATMGYSMRTDRYRFTVWQSAANAEQIIGVELYDHVTDPAENVNVAGLPENAALVQDLQHQLRAGWQAARPPAP
jgi:iduronate 2-sulfatase